MKFIRDLYFFVNLITLFLFVLQKLNAERCQKNVEEVKKTFNSFLKEVKKFPQLSSMHKTLPSVENLPDELKEKNINKSQVTPELSTFEPSTSSSAPINLRKQYMKLYSDMAKLSPLLDNLKNNDFIQNAHVFNNDFCEKLTQRCFDDVKQVIRKDEVNIFPTSFTTPTTSKDEDENIRNYIVNQIRSVKACSFIDKADNEINFFFTELGIRWNTFIVLFKRDDNKLEATDIKPFAINKEDDLLKEIRKLLI